MECADKSLEVKYELSDYFVIDLEYLHDEKNAEIILAAVKNKKVIFKTDFEEIPKILQLKDNDFELKGVIAFHSDSKSPKRERELITKHTHIPLMKNGYCIMI
ncbi:unnamed protein product [Parnassius apollo]|uniref:(apollo) hypothetical protein n=1 Tax=Parnassius apollo TaxID=110799 RepID=A0A8S3X0U6_PARAO|nr:unnamed protein product [Parnassius apollo]